MLGRTASRDIAERHPTRRPGRHVAHRRLPRPERGGISTPRLGVAAASELVDVRLPVEDLDREWQEAAASAQASASRPSSSSLAASRWPYLGEQRERERDVLGEGEAGRAAAVA